MTDPPIDVWASKYRDLAVRLFVMELHQQCKVARKAWGEITEANEALRRNKDAFDLLFEGTQGLLGTAANISKILWPNPAQTRPGGAPLAPAEEEAKKRTITRGKELRKVLSPGKNSPLQVNKVRNAFEHFDERLDTFIYERAMADAAGEPYATSVQDFSVFDGPATLPINGVTGRPIPHMRMFDSSAGVVHVFDASADVRQYMDAIEDLHVKCDEWLKNHPTA